MTSVDEIRVRPFWRIVEAGAAQGGEGVALRLAPGAGWGTGAHETTQLCLQAIAMLAPRGRGSWSLLDFGAGSGLLAIGAAKLGARVDAVEIDEEGVAHGEENARLNGVEALVRYSRFLGEGKYDLVVANILRPVLLEFAPKLAKRLAPGGTLILSGLVSTDVPEVAVRYGSQLNPGEPEVYQRGEWRALVWR